MNARQKSNTKSNCVEKKPTQNKEKPVWQIAHNPVKKTKIERGS